MAAFSDTTSPSTGVRAPDNPRVWPVRPWPADATFSDIVQHFLPAQPNLETGRSTARYLAFFRAYHAALTEAATSRRRAADDVRWQDELLKWVGICLAQYQEAAAFPRANGHTAPAALSGRRLA